MNKEQGARNKDLILQNENESENESESDPPLPAATVDDPPSLKLWWMKK